MGQPVLAKTCWSMGVGRSLSTNCRSFGGPMRCQSGCMWIDPRISSPAASASRDVRRRSRESIHQPRVRTFSSSFRLLLQLRIPPAVRIRQPPGDGSLRLGPGAPVACSGGDFRIGHGSTSSSTSRTQACWNSAAGRSGAARRMSGSVGWLSLRSYRFLARLALWQMLINATSSLWCVRVWCCSTSLGRYRS